MRLQVPGGVVVGVEELPAHGDLERVVVGAVEIGVRGLQSVVVDADVHALAGILLPDRLDVAEEVEVPLVGDIVAVDLGNGRGAARLLTADLSPAYVRFNSAYST